MGFIKDRLVHFVKVSGLSMVLNKSLMYFGGLSTDAE